MSLKTIASPAAWALSVPHRPVSVVIGSSTSRASCNTRLDSIVKILTGKTTSPMVNHGHPLGDPMHRLGGQSRRHGAASGRQLDAFGDRP